MRYILAILLLTALTACASVPQIAEPVVRVETVRETPPKSLLTCLGAPEDDESWWRVPESDGSIDMERPLTDQDFANLIVLLDEAGEDCRSKLAAVKRWAERQE